MIGEQYIGGIIFHKDILIGIHYDRHVVPDMQFYDRFLLLNLRLLWRVLFGHFEFR
jgi:hypothetical protein